MEEDDNIRTLTTTIHSIKELLQISMLPRLVGWVSFGNFNHSTCHKNFLCKIKLRDQILSALYRIKKTILTGMRFLEANH